MQFIHARLKFPETSNLGSIYAKTETEYNNKNYKSSLNKINKAINLLKEDGRTAPSDMITLRDRAKAAVQREEKERADAAKKKAAADKAKAEKEAASDKADLWTQRIELSNL